MLEEVIITLITITIFLMLSNLYLINRLPQNEPLNFEQTQNAIKVLTVPEITTALNASLENQQISEKIGTFTDLSRRMAEATSKFNDVVASKSKRAAWGEWHLEQELKEAFPEIKIRKEVKELGNVPDAHMRTPDGRILIIDSKFVYDTYNKILETPETQIATKKKLQTTFRNDVEKHVTKIRNDYVQPGKGTHESAYMFIPSMAVYEFLIDNESRTVRWAASQGVVICSPMTLMANMHMIEIARMAQNMTNMHNEILDAHLRVHKSYQEFEEQYKTLTDHLNKAVKKNNEVHGKVNEMNTQITALSSIDKSIENGSDKE